MASKKRLVAREVWEVVVRSIKFGNHNTYRVFANDFTQAASRGAACAMLDTGENGTFDDGEKVRVVSARFDGYVHS